MNLLFRALLDSVADAARARGIVHFRVAHKRNVRGELVVALIIDTGSGPLASIDMPEDDPREMRRQARLRR